MHLWVLSLWNDTVVFMRLWWIFIVKIVLFVFLAILQGVFLYLFIENNIFLYLGLLIFFSFISSIWILLYLNHKTRTWYIYNYMIAFVFIVLPALMASFYFRNDGEVMIKFQETTYSGIMVFFATLFLMVFANIQEFLEEKSPEEGAFKRKIKLYKPIALLFAFVGILAYAVPFATNPDINKIEKILFICSYLSITMFAQIAVLFKQDLEELESITNEKRDDNEYN